MDYSTQFVFLILCSKCVAVNIKRIEVPALVEMGTEYVILDCEYSIDVKPGLGLVMKWFFNGSSGLVYQWIPPLRPQVIGLLKDKVDITFRISEEPLQAYRAIKIVKPTTDLSGNYTCVVSTFMHEDRRTRSMLIYSTGKNFSFIQEKKYVFLVTLICRAEDLYPNPNLAILSQDMELKQAITEMKMNSWGLYSVTTKAIVHDDDVINPMEEFVCVLSLPSANFTANKTTTYYPGLMPASHGTTIEIGRPRERLASSGQTSTMNASLELMFYCIAHTVRYSFACVLHVMFSIPVSRIYWIVNHNKLHPFK